MEFVNQRTKEKSIKFVPAALQAFYTKKLDVTAASELINQQGFDF
tara:strand:- start:12340 stop:12474 length:135 start_codon:yes stop_codon:yes gene_type:complete